MQDNELSPDSDFPWPFQSAGIFTLPGGTYPEIPPNDYLSSFRDEYNQVQDSNGLQNMEFVS